MTLFLESQGLGYTVRHNSSPVPIINCVERADLVHRHGDQTVSDHERAWRILLDATTDASFKERRLAVPKLWKRLGSMLDDIYQLLTWRSSYVHQLENVQKTVGEDPRLFFARVDLCHIPTIRG